jgi:hypothetical protein
MSALLDPAPGAAASAPAADGFGGAGDPDGSGDRTEDGAAEGDRGDAGDERS